MAEFNGFETLSLIAAPPAMQPGGYIAEAYKDRLQPATPRLQLASAQQGDSWLIELRWECPEPVTSIAGETDLFTDAAAILVPGTMDAPWLTMGAPGNPVEAALWRADQDSLYRMRAEGMGSMTRSAPPADWSVEASWDAGNWRVRYQFADWPVLDQFGRIGLAVWRGANQERGGLKSVTEGWIAVR